MTKPVDLWGYDVIQFVRLLAEIRMAGLSNDTVIMNCLQVSMNLESEQIEEIFVRAEAVWEKIKDDKRFEAINICENCGAPAKYNSEFTLCKECEEL